MFFLLLLGIVEGGRFIFYYETLNNATREGARYAIVHGANSSCPSGPMPPGETAPTRVLRPRRRQRRAAGQGLGLRAARLGRRRDARRGARLGNGREADVNVAASYTYRTLVPLVPLPPITITAESTLVINN